MTLSVTFNSLIYFKLIFIWGVRYLFTNFILFHLAFQNYLLKRILSSLNSFGTLNESQLCWAWWCISAILILWRMGQGHYKFKGSMGYVTKPCLERKENQFVISHGLISGLSILFYVYIYTYIYI
jgi:hypothetical protein